MRGRRAQRGEGTASGSEIQALPPAGSVSVNKILNSLSTSSFFILAWEVVIAHGVVNKL